MCGSPPQIQPGSVGLGPRLPVRSDLLEQSFYVKNFLNFREDNSLQTVLRKGVSIYYFGNYESAVKARITLSPRRRPEAPPEVERHRGEEFP